LHFLPFETATALPVKFMESKGEKEKKIIHLYFPLLAVFFRQVKNEAKQ